MSPPVKEQGITPWDALLLAVRHASRRLALLDEKLDLALRNQEGDVTPLEVKYLIRESRLERASMARAAKAAIDAGVAERLVRSVEMEGKIIVRVIGRTLDQLGLTDEQRLLAHSVVHQELLAIEGAADLEDDGQATTQVTHLRYQE